MDQTALRFIDQRQAVLRDAYENYLDRFESPLEDSPPSLSRVSQWSVPGVDNPVLSNRYAWNRWSEQDLDDVIARCMANSKVKRKERFHRRLGNTEFRHRLKVWVREFLEDKGSMFRLYRKSGFDTEKALIALREVITFRIGHFSELTWLPESFINPPKFEAPHPRDEGPVNKRRSSSRTSAQSPVPTPSPEGEHSDVTGTSNVQVVDTIVHATGFNTTTTLLQLYPCSSKDPNRRPIAVVSLKYLQEEEEPSRSGGRDDKPIPLAIKQATAVFERLRIYLHHDAKESHGQGSDRRDALQFILVIDLAEGRVTTTAWNMVKWLVRDATDQFHGMCSAVFVVNYSWEFGAIWSFIKHILPASAKARVLFPTTNELVNYLGPDILPPSLSGLCYSPLPYYISVFDTYSPNKNTPGLRPTSPDVSNITDKENTQLINSAGGLKASAEKSRISRRASLRALHSTSYENPYYGYPVLQEEGVTTGHKSIKLQHSRKRKRDLLRTLSWLLLMTWRNRLMQLAATMWSRLRLMRFKSPLAICVLGIIIALYSRGVKIRDFIRHYYY
ncbi:hypothetical protein CPB86DRAFT_806111 [Serendipita vermifera]|nr:hypothetical protein CPB86DRAFT_806111 [Serendipita vermifera]